MIALLLTSCFLTPQGAATLRAFVEPVVEVVRGEPIYVKYKIACTTAQMETGFTGRFGDGWIGCKILDASGAIISSGEEPKYFVYAADFGHTSDDITPEKPLTGYMPLRFDTSRLAPGAAQIKIQIALPLGEYGQFHWSKIGGEFDDAQSFVVNVVNKKEKAAHDAELMLQESIKNARFQEINGFSYTTNMNGPKLRGLLLFDTEIIRPLLEKTGSSKFNGYQNGMIVERLLEDPTLQNLQAVDKFFAQRPSLEGWQWIRPLETSDNEDVAKLANRIMKRAEAPQPDNP